MIQLLKVELTRLRWRRACLVLLLGTVAVPLLIALGVVATHDLPGEETAQRIEQQVAADLRRAERQVERCVERPNRYGVAPDDDVRARCEEFILPRDEDMYYQYSYDVLDLDREREEGSGLAVAAVVGVLMFLMGTTFAGHDWATGSMSNQLLFQPRRLRAWVAKALAVGIAAVVVAAVAASAFWVALDLAVSSGGFEPRPGAFLDGLQQGWRAAALAGAAALGGYALTMLSRSTVFALGTLFAVSVAGGVLIAVLGPDDPGPVDPTINAAAIVLDGTEYYVEPPASCYSDMGAQVESEECSGERHRSLGEGALYYGGLFGAIGAASAYSFRRRDVP